MNSKIEQESHRRRHPRRAFLAATCGAAFSFTIVPRHVVGGAGFVPPSERVNVAGIGAGGMGGGDIATHARNGANIVFRLSTQTSFGLLYRFP